ncbi:MAG: hypothetical protein J2P52_05630 [Blastocatellia bacterium]|nr:hypothetical protein [Blastocatellia bacterium]
MKKFSPLIALTLLAGFVTLCALKASAQDEKQAQIERDTYAACWDKGKDESKCIQLCTEVVEKYPGSVYAKNCKTKLDNKKTADLWQKFQNGLKSYYDAPDIGKLEQFFATCEEFLKVQPGQQTVIGHMALAGADGAMGGVGYKSLDMVKGYAEAALKAVEPAAPPQGYEKQEWESLRELVLARVNQYLGWQLIVPIKGDQNLALDYLAKAIQVKSKDVIGWKDPYNYYLRAIVYNNQYMEARKPYDAMTDEQKVSDAGKEILKKIIDLLDTKLIPEYARVLATATSKETKPYADEVKPTFDGLWDYRTGAKDQAADYIKNYVDDPTIASVSIPAKPVDQSSLNAPAATTTVPGAVKLQSTKPAGATGANGNGAKSTPAKGRAKSKSKKP